MSYILTDHGTFFIPMFVTSIMVMRLIVGYYEQKYSKSKKALKELKSNEKEEKRSLISQMDPVIVETLREIVTSDMK